MVNYSKPKQRIRVPPGQKGTFKYKRVARGGVPAGGFALQSNSLGLIGIHYPLGPSMSDNWQIAAGVTINLTAEKAAYIGRVMFEGGPAAAKVLSAAGSGAILFNTGTVTFADGTSVLTLGIQDVNTGTTPPQPDGTFDVSATIASADALLVSNAALLKVMETGTKTIAHGDYIAIVADFTTRGGADSIVIKGINLNINQVPNMMGDFTTGAWTANSGVSGMFLRFDDGTWASLDTTSMMPVISTITAVGTSADNITNATSPDEIGLMWTQEMACETDALFINQIRFDAATSDYILRLFSDPVGTPTVLETFTINAEDHVTVGTQTKSIIHQLPAKRLLTRNTVYAVAIRANGAGNIRLERYTFGDDNMRRFAGGGLPVGHITRAGGAGAFTNDTDLNYNRIGVRITGLYSQT